LYCKKEVPGSHTVNLFKVMLVRVITDEHTSGFSFSAISLNSLADPAIPVWIRFRSSTER